MPFNEYVNVIYPGEENEDKGGPVVVYIIGSDTFNVELNDDSIPVAKLVTLKLYELFVKRLVIV